MKTHECITQIYFILEILMLFNEKLFLFHIQIYENVF